MDLVYISFSDKIQTEDDFVKLSDIGEIVCENRSKYEEIKNMKVHSFSSSNRDVITALFVVSLIERNIGKTVVVPLGAEEILLERIPKKKENRILQICKVIFVSMVSFFGTGFTIMAFHNDIGIRNVFLQISSLITGEAGIGMRVLEISYAFGLAAGIVVFFNHIGKRRLTKDPTPIEVSMCNYEEDVNKALIKTWDREGNTIEAD